MLLSRFLTIKSTMKKLLLFFFFFVSSTHIFSQKLDSLAKIAEIETIIHHQKSVNELKKFLKYSSKRKINYAQTITQQSKKGYFQANSVCIFISISTHEYVTGMISKINKENIVSNEDEFFFIFDVKNKLLFTFHSFSGFCIIGQDKTGKECFNFYFDKFGLSKFTYIFNTKKKYIYYEKEYNVLNVDSKSNFNFMQMSLNDFFEMIEKIRELNLKTDKNPQTDIDKFIEQKCYQKK